MTPKQLVRQLKAQGLRVALAESCTGGLVAAALTSVPGSSEVFDGGFITYSNEAKHAMLGVPKSLIAKYGAVSRQVAVAMANGALKHSRANVAIAVTGIAGPGGGSAIKPVGLVHFAGVVKGQKSYVVQMKFGDIGRARVRKLSVETALSLLENLTLREDLFRPRLKR